ncbi:hypothetical protein ACTXT7_014031 [Hymenolepis weldensis]
MELPSKLEPKVHCYRNDGTESNAERGINQQGKFVKTKYSNNLASDIECITISSCSSSSDKGQEMQDDSSSTVTEDKCRQLLRNLSKKKHSYDNGGYENEDELFADIQLMFDNCYLYHGLYSGVGAKGRDFERIFREEYAQIFSAPYLKVCDYSELSYKERQQLCTNISKLSATGLGKIIAFLKFIDKAGKYDSEDIEIDINSLSVNKLRKLNEFVKSELQKENDGKVTIFD